MAGLPTRPSVRFTVATSPSGVSRPYWAAITSYPSAWSGGITLLKLEPSAQIPWQKTTLGLCVALFILEPPSTRARANGRPTAWRASWRIAPGLLFLTVGTDSGVVQKRAEHLGSPLLEVVVLLKSALNKNLDALLRFGPREGRLKGVEGPPEPIGGRQRDLVDEMLRRRDGTPVKRGDPAREQIDKAV